MTLQGMVQQIKTQYGADIKKLTGAQGINLANVQFVNSGTTDTAYTVGKDIVVNRAFWNSLDPKDQRGMLIHEMTHVSERNNSALAGDVVGKPWASNPSEMIADAVRLTLNGAHGINPASLSEARHYANKEGWSNMGFSGQGGQQGPRLPRTDGGKGEAGRSARNGAANTYSKGTNPYAPGASQGSTNATLPALSPAETQNYYQQLSGLASQYQDQLAALKQQRVGARADFRSSLAAARQQEIGGIAQAEGSALGNNMVGSSADLANRAGVRGSFAAQQQQLQQQKLSALIQSRLGAQQAATGYAQGMYALQGNYLAQQQSAEAAAMANNTIISGQEAQMNFWRKMYNAQLNGQQAPAPPPTATAPFTFPAWDYYQNPAQYQRGVTGQAAPV